MSYHKEILWRATILGFAGLLELGLVVSAQIYVRPGDTVSLPTPIANSDDSGNPGGTTINSIKLTVAPLSCAVHATSRHLKSQFC